jgi:hypothetical protein
MLVATPTFTPSPYIPLQAVTFTPIYTMEVNSSFGRIEKFSRRLGTIFLREFKGTFSTVICELELKYGANYIEAFAFKQLAHYVHYEALDVYTNILPTMDALAFANPMGEFFRVLELRFSVKSSKFFLQLAIFFQ